VRAGSEPSSALPPALQVDGWRGIPGLVHGFFGRSGGVSDGAWASLNVSEQVGDAPSAVAANRERIGRCFPGMTWARMHQVHGVRVVRVGSADEPIGDADGMISATRGLALAVSTADCVPILCVAPAAGTVMALHAGWRGTLGGVATAGLAEAEAWLGIPPAAWRVAMGPSIGGCCYEVETRIGEQLVDRWGAMPDAWYPAGIHGRLDLRAANRAILLAHGVPASQITAVGPCTSCESHRYFSHRRSGGRAGRQLSGIGWAA